tara:strand:- start:309 stop:665 length:357 start_codon:yes stop_codon:yes gene_type:complete
VKTFYIFIFLSTLHSNSELKKEIKQNLVSPCCWAGTIYDLDHNPEIEKKIEELIDSGYNKNEILDYFVNIHGKRILAVPKAEGFNILVWIIPVIVALGSIIFISLFFYKQHNIKILNN